MNITSFLSQISIYEWVLIGLYFFFFVVQLFYYLYLFRKPYQDFASNGIKSEDKEINKKELPGITVIITAKNEDENLRRNLPFILNQDYPNYQVVVVDNGSTDSTNDVLNNFRQHHANLYITYIPIGSEKVNDKKLALTIGIKAAIHDILLFTEPDSKPLSKRWIYEYAKTFNQGKKVVIGCCQLEIKKGFFKKFILFDNLFSGVKYLSMALSKRLYIGVGRNMAFKKNLFFENKGFSSVLNIEDGEDDVFINKIATKENTAAVTSKDSMVISNVVEGLSTWRNIKTKYLNTQKHLLGNATKLLSFEVISRYAFYLLFVALCLVGIFSSMKLLIPFVILLFLIRVLVQIVVINKNSKLYNSGSFYFSLLLFDLISPIVDQIFLNFEAKRNLK